MIGNNTYIAVIDSGSQVNLIRDDVYRNDVKVLKVTDVEMSLRKANGGGNILIGLVPNLEIWIGALKTLGNVWISENCPPAVLLGHPWQCENMVSIDEHTNGMYLRFSEVKDSENHATPMEVLLQPHDSKKGNRRHMSNIPCHCAGLALANLALVVEPMPSDISQNGNDPLSNAIINTQELYRETTQSVFKSYCTESLEPQASMKVEYDLQDSYSQLFQLDLLTQSYGTAPSNLNNSCLGPLASTVHAPIGNWAADYLALPTLLNSPHSNMRYMACKQTTKQLTSSKPHYLPLELRRLSAV